MSYNILILGAAGYIGGTVLMDLLQKHQPKEITALVRTDTQEELLAPLGINVVVGDLSDVPLLTRLVESSDLVFNFAVPFNGGDKSIQALVDGLEARARLPTTNVKPVLLQTSGSGSVLYGSDGDAGFDIWKDSDHERWNELPDTAYFHAGDKIIAQAAERGIISAYIIMSPTVYGQGSGPGNKLSLQVPAYVRYAKRSGQAAYIGKGENIWGNVHVKDLSSLYLIVATYALKSPESTAALPNSHGWSNLIYAGLGQHTWKPIIELLGDLLHARGDIAKGGAISIPEGSGEGYMFGGNSFMAVSDKAKALGWKQGELDLADSMRQALGPK